MAVTATQRLAADVLGMAIAKTCRWRHARLESGMITMTLQEIAIHVTVTLPSDDDLKVCKYRRQAHRPSRAQIWRDKSTHRLCTSGQALVMVGLYLAVWHVTLRDKPFTVGISDGPEATLVFQAAQIYFVHAWCGQDLASETRCRGFWVPRSLLRRLSQPLPSQSLLNEVNSDIACNCWHASPQPPVHQQHLL